MPIGKKTKIVFAFLHLASMVDDWYFLFVSIYPYWFLLFLNCLANLVLPIYCIVMAFYMKASNLERLTNRTTETKRQSFFVRLKFALLDMVNYTSETERKRID